MPYPFIRTVIHVYEPRFPIISEGLVIDCESMVLRSDVTLVRSDHPNRLVMAPVAVFQFICIGAPRPGEELVAHAYSENRLVSFHRLAEVGHSHIAELLEIMPDGYGFLRSSDYNYLNSPDDIYVSQGQIKNNALKSGDTVTGEIRPPKEGDKYFPLVRIKYINGRTPDYIRDRVPFDFLTPLFPDEKFNLLGHGHQNDVSCRIVDMFTPIGKGQRGLIVSQPKTGKTMLLKSIARMDRRMAGPWMSQAPGYRM